MAGCRTFHHLVGLPWGGLHHANGMAARNQPWRRAFWVLKEPEILYSRVGGGAGRRHPWAVTGSPIYSYHPGYGTHQARGRGKYNDPEPHHIGGRCIGCSDTFPVFCHVYGKTQEEENVTARI